MSATILDKKEVLYAVLFAIQHGWNDKVKSAHTETVTLSFEITHPLFGKPDLRLIIEDKKDD